MPDNLVQRSQLSDQADGRLFCFPFAGGGSAAFHRWRPVMPESIDLVPLNLPGREGRIADPPARNLVDLARDCADALMPAIDRPYTLLGHSMGAWLAFEVARELRRRKARSPALLVVAASPPADHMVSDRPLYNLPDDAFLAELESRYDAIPPAVRSHPELLQLLLPMLRADIEMVDTYHCAEEPPLDVELLVLGGSDDPTVSAAQLERWRRHTARKCTVRLFPGEHFFLFRDGNETASAALPTSNRAASAALQLILRQVERILKGN